MVQRILSPLKSRANPVKLMAASLLFTTFSTITTHQLLILPQDIQKIIKEYCERTDIESLRTAQRQDHYLRAPGSPLLGNLMPGSLFS
ncbi:unnamed protein product [Eruca vesicaria subsp. sativa]|uniref:Uncharacterized protein n=1 Tax=Eruca vesicaria subsp. sativa TaxID=29727 RepID=A0ABC8JQB0_ERUVS|nr:unnamed protein product [Eruca vesicaria subsp. sativa]